MATIQPQITIRYTSCDRVSETRRYLTLAGAQRYAHGRVGEHPELGGWYAVSGDGVGKVTVTGITLARLFPGPVEEAADHHCVACGCDIPAARDWCPACEELADFPIGELAVPDPDPDDDDVPF